MQAAAEESKKHAIDASYRVKAFKLDTTDRKAVEELVQMVAKQFGRIDYLVHSAGVCRKSFDDTDMARLIFPD